MRSVRLLAVLAALTLAATPAAASAAFPGANGLIVFEHELPAGDHTQADLYTIDPVSKAVHRLTNTADLNEFGPQWNAAGTKLAFWRTPAPFGPGTVWTMAANGSRLVQLTTGIDARDPAWSPDGKRIVFTRETSNGSQLWSMRSSDGGGLRRLTAGALDFEPAWSPHGTTIAFTRGSAQGDPGDIFVLTVATGAVTRITHSPAYDHQVAWAPDGRTLVFERDLGASSSIDIVPVAGGTVTALTSGPYFDISPAWSPDGTAIAFGSDRHGGGLDDLFVMNSDGSGLHLVRALPYSEGFPDWQPLVSGARPAAPR